MLRSMFFSVGMFVTLWGVTFLFVDKLVLSVADEKTRPHDFRGLFTSLNKDRKKEFNPPDWSAFSLLSLGSVTMLYAVALPKKKD